MRRQRQQLAAERERERRLSVLARLDSALARALALRRDRRARERERALAVCSARREARRARIEEVLRQRALEEDALLATRASVAAPASLLPRRAKRNARWRRLRQQYRSQQNRRCERQMAAGAIGRAARARVERRRAAAQVIGRSAWARLGRLCSPSSHAQPAAPEPAAPVARATLHDKRARRARRARRRHRRSPRSRRARRRCVTRPAGQPCRRAWRRRMSSVSSYLWVPMRTLAQHARKDPQLLGRIHNC